MPRALITGITGQDGSYLAELLLDRGYEVHGLVRDPSAARSPHLAGILGQDRVSLHSGDLLNDRELLEVIREAQPDEIYNLAAMSFVPESWDQPAMTAEFTAVAVARMLEAMREVCPQARFYQASSSEMFGSVRESPQSELTPFQPHTPYGAAKAYAHFITMTYRQSRDMHCSSGILFNHESPRRGTEFVTRKISQAAAAIKLGLQQEVTLGDLEAKRDWGYAPDYVEAMWLMLQQDEPGDYVIGTGVHHSVRELVEIAFDHLSLDAADHVRIDQDLIRPAEVSSLLADASKARRVLGWEPRTSFPDLIRTMVDADLELLRESGTPELRQG